VSTEVTQGRPGATLAAPPAVTVPGSLPLTARAPAAEGDVSGFVFLHRGPASRRIPFWFRASAPRLGRDRHHRLARAGTYRGTTRGQAARVSCYRYPAGPTPLGVPACLRGPEEVFRIRLARPVANFGVAVLSEGRGVHVQPRVTRAGDENRLTGYAGLPLNLNPYLTRLDQLELVAGAVRPDAGAYDIVFDTPSRRAAGRFTFRFWIGDTTPPRVRLLAGSVPRGRDLLVRIADSGSGVDPSSIHATLDGRTVPMRYRAGIARIPTSSLGARGAHRLVVRASDFQEAKNMENTGPILPNTGYLRASVVAG
jgi:hypothetical protein